MTRASKLRERQRGAALLMMMLVVLVAATAVLVTRLNLNDARARQQTEAQDALAHARDALLDYAALRGDFAPGEAARLPCPDIDAAGGWLEGEAHDSACGAANVSVMGRLPWRTLGIAPLKDSAGACLWYVVSGSHKDAAGGATMVNPDTNGQLQLHGVEAGAIIAGSQPEDRVVAMIIAPMRGLAGQSRAAPSATGEQCSASFDAAEFLDNDVLSGISNAAVSGVVDVIDVLAATSGYADSHNDRIAMITRADLARVVTSRHDFASNMRALGLAVTACVADYARNNPGGGPPGGGPPGGGPPGGGPPGGGPPGGGPPGGGPPGGGNDYRLPWPAALSLLDYRPDAAYDDSGAGLLSGRLPDTVDDSSAETGNPIGQMLTGCDPAAVPSWTPAMLAAWRNWKDHFFYAVAESFSPAAPVPSGCTTCLTVNGAGQYAAIVLFANPRLEDLAQLRNAPPIDADTRSDASNYLEAADASNVPYAGGSVDFMSQAASSTFNDLLFCIDDALNVSEC